MKKKYPKVSVVMSVYNPNPTHLKKSIYSILDQTFKSFEFIIINDRSNLKISSLLDKLRRKDKRIILLNNIKNLGLTKSLNKGIAISRGEFLARMDSDDISNKNRLDKQVKFLKNNKDIDLISANSFIINKRGKIIGQTNMPIKYEDILNKIFFFNPIIHPLVMAKKNFFKKNKYNVNFQKCQDYELWMRTVKKYKFFNLKHKLLYYRQNKKNYRDLYYSLKVIIQYGIKEKNIKCFEGLIRIIISYINLRIKNSLC